MVPPMPRISLCMILRDEAEMLPRFLAAAQGVWDELCVVDTGSKDATVELVLAAGGTVTRSEWKDDFAAARNASLAMAHGEWILVLDADEVVSPRAIAEIRRVVGQADVGAATLIMENRLPQGHWRSSRLLRLFRNTPGIAYQHRIHEDASPSISRALQAAEQRVAHLSARVEHLGYSLDRAVSRQKRVRDTRLLARSIIERPDDLYSWFKLLEQARFWGDRALSRSTAQAAVRELERFDGVKLRTLHYGSELVSLLSEALHRDSPEQALRFMNDWWPCVMPTCASHMRRGELRELTGDLDGAQQDFAACLAVNDYSGDIQLAVERPRLGLVRIAMAQGKIDLARVLVSETLELNACDLEALLAATVLARSTGGEAAIKRFVARHVKANGDSAELHQALGDEALLSGDTGRAVTELALAARKSTDQRISLRLSQAYLADGQVGQARGLIDALLPNVPEAALGLLMCDLLEGVNSEIEADLDPVDADASLREWVHLVLKHGTRPVVERFKQVIPAVQEQFPWLAIYATPPPANSQPEAR